MASWFKKQYQIIFPPSELEKIAIISTSMERMVKIFEEMLQLQRLERGLTRTEAAEVEWVVEDEKKPTPLEITDPNDADGWHFGTSNEKSAEIEEEDLKRAARRK